MRYLKTLAVAIFFGALGLGLGLGLTPIVQNLCDRPDLSNPAQPNHALETIFSPGGRAWAQSVIPHTPGSSGSHRHTRIVDIAQSVSPAVVSIGVSKTTYVRQYDPFGVDLFFQPYLIAPRQQNFPYLGSGFIIDTEGHVITNYHVVEDSTSIRVTLTDKRSYEAELLDADRYVDVALLKLIGLAPGEGLPTIKLGDSDDIMIGESVLAIGNPFGPLIADPRPSVSVGVISASNRSFKDSKRQRSYQDMIQTDAAINPGNSGGPLVNLDGEAIGINTFIFSHSGDSANVGFSIPINRVAKIADEIIRFGKVRAIRMDFEIWNLTPYIIQALNLNVKTGALIKAIDIGGPAERSGLKPGDVITDVNEQEVETADDLLTYFLSRTVGEKVMLTVIRQENPLEIEYFIEEGTR